MSVAAQDSEITVTRRHPLIGTEVGGVDLARADDAICDRIREIWMQHPLLIFPDQPISDAEQIAFAKHFGALEIHPSVEHRSSRHPEIYRVANVDEAGRLLATDKPAAKYLSLTWLWHTDSSFRAVPSLGSVLHGIEVPADGGDTLFANMYAVYDALPPELQARLAGLRAVHSHDHVMSLTDGLAPADESHFTQLDAASHPLIRRHPVTDRRSLFISPHTMAGIEGMGDGEARALFDDLIAFATQDRFVYRHKWRPHDVIMWDNRCTMHAVMPYDAANVRRIMHCTTIVGDGPVLPG